MNRQASGEELHEEDRRKRHLAPPSPVSQHVPDGCIPILVKYIRVGGELGRKVSRHDINPKSLSMSEQQPDKGEMREKSEDRSCCREESERKPIERLEDAKPNTPLLWTPTMPLCVLCSLPGLRSPASVIEPNESTVMLTLRALDCSGRHFQYQQRGSRCLFLEVPGLIFSVFRWTLAGFPPRTGS